MSMMDIIKAMGQVKDEQIDPTTGKTITKSNKSILDKCDVELDEKAKKEILENVKKDEEAKGECLDIVKTYCNMTNRPIVESKQEESDGFIHVGEFGNEEAEEQLMDSILKAMKKK